ncbi:MAG TPA: hypothetical protein DHV86_03490, partial [Methylophilaceae bacterium]|nr:hypothetical protein [Methylophilaceae bacterium]
DNILSNKLSFINSLFLEKSYSENEIKIAINLILQSLKWLKDGTDGRWIYRLHNEDKIESRYQITTQEIECTLIPDRAFIEGNKRWIIDYKTLFYDKNIDLDIEAKKHLPQLVQYEKLFDGTYKIQKAIYFVVQGRLILI